MNNVLGLTLRSKLEFRAEGDGKCYRGHAAVFFDGANQEQTQYQIWWDYVERLAAGCFDRAINDNDDTRHLFDHDSSRLIGKRSAGTLKLSVDNVGLAFESPYDETDPDHQSYRAKILRGDLDGCSFAFSSANTVSEYREEPHPLIEGETLWIRTITEVGTLYDVGGVTYPAYEGTDLEFNSRVNLRQKRCQMFAGGSEAEFRSAAAAHRAGLDQYLAKRSARQRKFDYQWKRAQQRQQEKI